MHNFSPLDDSPNRVWRFIAVSGSLVLSGICLIMLLASGVRAKTGSTPSAKSGKEIYRAACASCHGADGRGASKYFVGFDLPLPDLTDCNFTTREPNRDWSAIFHNGGPARGFDKLMPAFGTALTEEEITNVIEYVRSLCSNPSWPRGELNFPRPLVTEKAFVEDEAVITSAVTVDDPQAVNNKFIFEKRVASRGQIELIVPFAFLESNGNGWEAGLGDIAFGSKWALFHSLKSGSIVSLAAEVILPTGNKETGFGKGVTVIEPFIAVGQWLPFDSFCHLQAGAELSTDPEAAPHEVFGRGALGISFHQGRFGRIWSPIVEALALREIEEGQVINWDLVPQLQVTLSTRHHIMASVGSRIPINDFNNRSVNVLFYLLWDWFDGGFFEGW